MPKICGKCQSNKEGVCFCFLTVMMRICFYDSASFNSCQFELKNRVFFFFPPFSQLLGREKCTGERMP